jgi:peptide/nickel transport system ATP-binding protein
VVYQNPAEAVSHRLRVADIVAEPLQIHGLLPDPAAIAARVAELLAMVRLPTNPEFLRRYPHELNLGAVQRVCLARALALSPGLLVADEPTSALDPSVQAKVLKMVLELQIENGLSLLFVTHDIGLARKIADRIAVMHAGALVEIGPASAVLGRPIHPYTRMLVNGAGRADHGAGASPGASTSGCAFAQRCPGAMKICFHRAPEGVGSDPHRHAAACHLGAAN